MAKTPKPPRTKRNQNQAKTQTLICNKFKIDILMFQEATHNDQFLILTAIPHDVLVVVN